MHSQIDFPFNIRPLNTDGSIRHLLVDNDTRADYDIENFLLVPVIVDNKQPKVTDTAKIRQLPPDSNSFTRFSINFTEFQEAQYIVLLTQLHNTFRIQTQHNQPVGTTIGEGENPHDAIESFLANSPWQSYAIPVPTASRSFAMIFSSCQYPGDLFRRETPKATLNRALKTIQSDSFVDANLYLLIAGDGVYVDPTAGLFEPKSENEKFKVAYEAQARSDPWQALLIKMHGTYFAIDDHELIDNWEPSNNETINTELKNKLNLGREWFLRRRRGESDHGQHLWGEYQLGEIPLFVMDTRTERSHRTPENHRIASMIGQCQMHALKKWLLSADNEPDFKSVPKIILSPSMILPRSLRTAEATQDVCDLKNDKENEDTIISLSSDSWDGFPQTSGEILSFIAEKQIHNVVFLSGDEHISCVAKAKLSTHCDSPPIVAHSIHASPLYGPYPFANAKPSDFAENETFTQPFLDENGVAKTVDVAVTSDTENEGDAFGILHVKQSDNGAWDVSVTLSVADQKVKQLRLNNSFP